MSDTIPTLEEYAEMVLGRPLGNFDRDIISLTKKSDGQPFLFGRRPRELNATCKAIRLAFMADALQAGKRVVLAGCKDPAGFVEELWQHFGLLVSPVPHENGNIQLILKTKSE